MTATADDVVAEHVGTFRQKARIPRGLLTALILAGIVLLWALIFLFVITGLQRGEPAAKATGTNLMTGDDYIPLTAVAATAQGTVTASTTGDGIPRITVEALRTTSDGTLESVGSAATDDDGTYSLKSLIPGTYVFRFSADGYSEVWYPASPDAAGAEEVVLDPKQVRDDLDVVLSGQAGRLLGSIALPPDAPAQTLTVTATLTDGPADQPPFTITTETTDGTIDLSGLPTPGTYQVTVTGPGFQTQQFEQTLDGGQASVINTVDLTAADGSITGTVLNGAGQPLGGVFVTARSGDVELKTVTPTAGNVGQFSLVGLTTPQTYVLTFSLPGSSSATAALSLAAGESRSGVVATLVGGSGTATGTVVSSSGAPLGGVTVTVLGDNFDSTTSTLTTSGTAGAAGSFTMSGLPVPGNYTFSFSSPGLQTETVGASFLAAGQQSVGTVTLLPETAVIQGTVSGPSGALGFRHRDAVRRHGEDPGDDQRDQSGGSVCIRRRAGRLVHADVREERLCHARRARECRRRRSPPAERDLVAERGSLTMRTLAWPEIVEVSPGADGLVSVAITNTSSVIDAYRVQVFGLDPEWVEVVPPRLSLFPGETSNVDIHVRLPEDYPASQRMLTVNVTSDDQPGSFSLTQVALDVRPATKTTVALDPTMITGGRAATFGLVVSNVGNAPVTATGFASDPEDLASSPFNHPMSSWPPGANRSSRSPPRADATGSALLVHGPSPSASSPTVSNRSRRSVSSCNGRASAARS